MAFLTTVTNLRRLSGLDSFFTTQMVSPGKSIVSFKDAEVSPYAIRPCRRAATTQHTVVTFGSHRQRSGTSISNNLLNFHNFVSLREIRTPNCKALVMCRIARTSTGNSLADFLFLHLYRVICGEVFGTVDSTVGSQSWGEVWPHSKGVSTHSGIGNADALPLILTRSQTTC
jgi:hypothetical protein